MPTTVTTSPGGDAPELLREAPLRDSGGDDLVCLAQLLRTRADSELSELLGDRVELVERV